jgi:ComF family protein
MTDMNLLDLLFPKTCVGCGKYGGYFCSNCVRDIKQTELVCPFCERQSLGGVIHAICKRKYGLDGLWSLGVYEGHLRKAIQKLKYKWVSEIAKELVDVTVEYWAKNSPLLLDKIKKDQGQSWIVTAVPLHSKRQNWRGFNQSELLGKIFALKLGLKYESTLKRIRNTTPQMKLEAQARRMNIKNAFEAAAGLQLSGVKILLIDDVWTTGSTLKECCYVLKRSGAGSVWALTVAR